MRERRQWPRYDISDNKHLEGKTENGPLGEQLMTLSQAGCGFWAPLEDCHLKPGERVEVNIWGKQFKKPNIALQGEVLYVVPYPLDSQIGKFYGVRFYEQEVADLKELIDQLATSYQRGKISMAP